MLDHLPQLLHEGLGRDLIVHQGAAILDARFHDLESAIKYGQTYWLVNTFCCFAQRRRTNQSINESEIWNGTVLGEQTAALSGSALARKQSIAAVLA